VNLSTIRDGLAVRLATISGLRVHKRWPGSVNAPAVVIGGPAGTYDATFSGTSHTVTFPLHLFVSAAEIDRAQQSIDTYLDDGAGSIQAAIEADPDLAGAISSVHVTGWRDYGLQSYAGNEFMGVTIEVEVFT
jgi:hypothetical protein